MNLSKRTVVGILSFSMIVNGIVATDFVSEKIKQRYSTVYAYDTQSISDIEGVSFSDNSNDTTFLVQEFKPEVAIASSLNIDGKAHNVAGLKIDGSNYYSIRDLANAMKDTTGRFKLSYDAETNKIVIDTGYNEVNNENVLPLDLNYVSEIINYNNSKISFLVNGSEIQVSGYFLNENNYINLKELSLHLGYKMNYNDIEDCVYLDTTSSICSYIRDVVYNPQFTYNPFTKIELSLEDVNKILAGTKLADYGQYFMNMQETYGVNIVYAMSVAYLESGAGKITCGSYNYFGMIGKNYSSPEEGINAFGKLMNNKMYYGKSIEQIAPTYCNSAWAGKIKSMMDFLWKKI